MQCIRKTLRAVLPSFSEKNDSPADRPVLRWHRKQEGELSRAHPSLTAGRGRGPVHAAPVQGLTTPVSRIAAFPVSDGKRFARGHLAGEGHGNWVRAPRPSTPSTLGFECQVQRAHVEITDTMGRTALKELRPRHLSGGWSRARQQPRPQAVQVETWARAARCRGAAGPAARAAVPEDLASGSVSVVSPPCHAG